MSIKRFFSLGLAMALAGALSSCAGSKDTVKFADARNYFYQGNNNEISVVKIATAQQFDRLFGPAAFMGKGGEPTEVDFERSFVIAIVLPESNRRPEITDVKLQRGEGKKLIVNYKVHYSVPVSYTTRPVRLLIVDRKYAGWSIKGQQH